ncbi:MAG: xanthine phosphoribosyltransferase, partial [Oscillospiraceae bacterium]|nr:xanthine phosphoribosyltransferase [Oscillospiraceae bacterium]
LYQAKIHSFTKDTDAVINVSKDYLSKDDRVLIIDDFLAHGEAVSGLIDIIGRAGAELSGVGIAIEKGFQSGGKMLREKGVRVESLAIIKSVENGKISFET